MRLRSGPGAGRDERGTATTFVVGFAVVLLACAGLVIDGGNAINARMKLADDVEQAARAGAGAIDIEALRAGGDLTLDESEAEARARTYMGRLGYTDVNARAAGDSVAVSAQDTVPTALLQLVGKGSFTISATATADAVTQ